MSRRWSAVSPVIAVALCAAALACSDEPRAANRPAESIVVRDATGREVPFAAPARRIVSLVPSATETLHALGASTALVGRTDYDEHEWVRNVPSVGGGLEPSLEAIVALEPDLVIRFAGEQDPRTRQRLHDLGIPYLSVRPERIDDIIETVHMLAAVTGRTAAGDSLASTIEVGLDQTRRAVGAWPRLRVAYVLGGTPPWVSGPGTYIDEILTLIGGDNVFHDLDALYSSVSPEELLSREIDVVLVASRSEFDASLTPGARIVEVGDELEIPGPAVVREARRVAALMHGRTLR